MYLAVYFFVIVVNYNKLFIITIVAFRAVFVVFVVDVLGVVAVIDVVVSTQNDQPVAMQLEIDQTLAHTRSVSESIQMGLKPLIGERLLAPGMCVYIVDADEGGRCLVTKETAFADVLGAAAVEIELKADAPLALLKKAKPRRATAVVAHSADRITT